MSMADAGWMIRHRYTYLHYKVVVTEPLDHFRLKATGPGGTTNLIVNDSPGTTETFQGALDVSGLLTLGAWYGLYFEIDFEGTTTAANIFIQRLWESDATSVEPAPAAGAYAVPPEWEQNYTVSAADMNKYKSALDAARSQVSDQAFNLAVRRNDTQDRGFWFVHRHRWLHHVGDGEIVDPSGAGEAVEISGVEGQFSVFDLYSVPWLTEGTLYNVKDANYAVEDYDA